MIYKIAQVDFSENWKNSIQKLGDKIKEGVKNEPIMISGLMALNEIFDAKKYHIDKDCASLNE